MKIAVIEKYFLLHSNSLQIDDPPNINDLLIYIILQVSYLASKRYFPI